MEEEILSDKSVIECLRQEGFITIECICNRCLGRVIALTLKEFPDNLVSIDINPLHEKFYQVNIALSDAMDDIIE